MKGMDSRMCDDDIGGEKMTKNNYVIMFVLPWKYQGSTWVIRE